MSAQFFRTLAKTPSCSVYRTAKGLTPFSHSWILPSITPFIHHPYTCSSTYQPSIHTFIHLFIHPSFHSSIMHSLSTYLSTHPSLHALYTHPSIPPIIHPSIHPSTHPPIPSSTYPFWISLLHQVE